MTKSPLPSGPERNTALQPSEELQKLCQRAASGSAEEFQRLTQWAVQSEGETLALRRRLRKQEHDFSTLFEIVGQTSARSLDLLSMQTYLLRTVSGHFTTSKLVIARKMRSEDKLLISSAAQGLRDVKVNIPANSPLCEEALRRRFCLFLGELPEKIALSPEVMVLRELGLDLAVPLIQEVELPETVLEGFLLLGTRLANRAYAGPDLDFLNILGKMLAICLRNEALYRRSIIDDLTGVASRGHFDARLVQEINRIQIYGHKGLGLVMLDVDQFKSFNDRFGHQTGDRVLQELAAVLVRQVRNVDLVARYGGEEFAIILLEIDRASVLEVSQRLRRAVEAMKLTSVDGQELRITASFGAACFPEDAEDKAGLIQRSDQALYVAKDGGRNRVVMAQGRARLPHNPMEETTTLRLAGNTPVPERRRPSSRALGTAEPAGS